MNKNQTPLFSLNEFFTTIIIIFFASSILFFCLGKEVGYNLGIKETLDGKYSYVTNSIQRIVIQENH